MRLLLVLLALGLTACNQADIGAVQKELTNTSTDSSKPLFSDWRQFYTGGLGKLIPLSTARFGETIIEAKATTLFTYRECLTVTTRADGSMYCAQDEYKSAEVSLSCSQSVTIGGNDSEGTILASDHRLISADGCPQSGVNISGIPLKAACESAIYECSVKLPFIGGVYVYKKSNYILQIGDKFFQ